MTPSQRSGTIALSWGPWGGFYVYRGFNGRVCLGWLAITYCPVELDDMMEAWTERAEARSRRSRSTTRRSVPECESPSAHPDSPFGI